MSEERGVDLPHIRQARERISPYIFRTPLVRSGYLSRLCRGEVYLKLECQQLLNSFKIRGAVNRFLTLTPQERRRGVLAVSSGNHAAAVSFCSERWGVPAEVWVPEPTPGTKIDKIRTYGAKVRVIGRDYDETCRFCREHLARLAHPVALPGSADDAPPLGPPLYFDPAADPVAVAGHGTIGLEIVEDLPAVEAILVPVGGGGLITGISLAAKGGRDAMAGGSGEVASDSPPAPEMIGVQTEACPALKASLDEGVFYESYPIGPSVCDAVVGGVGELAYRLAGRCIDRVALAGEGAVKRAVVDLIRHDKVVAEPSGALGVAYVAAHPEEFAGRRVAIVISGGNLDFSLLRGEICRDGA